MSGAGEAERLFRAGLFEQAREAYGQLAEVEVDPARRVEWRLRESISLGHMGRRGAAFEAARLLLPQAEGTVWEPRTLRWIGLLHERSGVHGESRRALTAARLLYPEFRGEDATRAEEIRLNLELIAALNSHGEHQRRHGTHRDPGDPYWDVDPNDPYSRDWPTVKQIRYLFRQIQWLAGSDAGSAEAAISAGIAEACWLQRCREHERLHGSAKAPGYSSFPYMQVSPREVLEPLVTRFAGHPRLSEVLLALGAFETTSGELASAATTLRRLMESWPHSPEGEQAAPLLEALVEPRVRLHAEMLHPVGRPVRVRAWVRNVDAFELQLYRLDLEAAWAGLPELECPVEQSKTAAKLSPADSAQPFDGLLGPWSHVRSFMTPEGEAWREGMAGTADRWWHARDLEVPIQEAGAYVLEARGGDVTTPVLLIVTPLALIERAGEAGTRFHLVDVRSGEPVAGAGLRVHVGAKERKGKPGERLVREERLTTNAQGWVELPLSLQRSSISVLAAADGQVTLLPEHTGEAPESGKELRAFGTIDRGAYHPGETLQFRWIVMRRCGDEWRPAPWMTLVVSLWSYYRGGSPWRIVMTNGYGSAAGSLRLPAKLPTGEYQLRVSSPFSLDVRPVAVRIEEFRTPEAMLTLTPVRAALSPGEPAEICFQAKYLTGEPLAGANVQYRVYEEVVLAQYSYLLPRYLQRYPRGGKPADGGELVLDRHGRADLILEPSFAKGGESRMLIYRLEATLQDPGGRAVEGGCHFVVFVVEPKAEIRHSPRYGRPGEAVSITVALKTGEAVPQASGRLTLRHRDRDGEGKPEASFAVRSGQGGGEPVTWMPEEPGEYRLHLEWQLEDGETATAEAPFRVHAGDEREDSSDELLLIPERDGWRQGDTLRALLVTPEPGCMVLLRFEREAELSEEVWVRVPGQTYEIVRKLEERDYPTAFIHARTVRNGRVFEAQLAAAVQPVAPILQVAVALGGPERVELNAARPGDAAEIRVETRDANGEPVAAEVSLGVRNAGVDQIHPVTGCVVETYFSQRSTKLRSFSGLGREFVSDPYIHRSWRRLHAQWRMPPLPEPLGFPGELGGDGYRDWTWWVRFDDTEWVHLPAGETIGPFGHRTSLAWGAGSRRIGCLGGGMADITAALGELSGGEEACDATDFGRSLTLPAPGEIRVRRDFQNTAFWAARLRTGRRGTANVRFRWPDDLTEWRARTLAITRRGLIGQAEVELRTTLPLLVRARCPRFLIEGDRAELTALVQSGLSEPIEARVALEIEPAEGVGIEGEAEVSLRLEPGGTAAVAWPVEARSPGALRVRMRVRAPAHGDAVEQVIPVLCYGAVETRSVVGELREEATARIGLPVPASYRPETVRLVVRATPSVLGLVRRALRYLEVYPYDCAEQTISAIWPAALAERTLGRRRWASLRGAAAPVVKARALGTAIQSAYAPVDGAEEEPATGPGRLIRFGGTGSLQDRALRRLFKTQNHDGGWGWWPDGSSNPEVTLYVYQGLLSLHAVGCRIPAAVRLAARAFVARLLKANPSPAVQVEAVYLLSLAREPGMDVERWAAEELFPQRAALNPSGRARLALALAQLRRHDLARMVADELTYEARAEPATGSMGWSDDLPGEGWRLGRTETTALVLQALIRVRTESPLIDPAMRELVRRRRGAAWRSTRETSAVVRALLEYAVLRRESRPDLELQFRVNGVEAGIFPFRGRNQPVEQCLEVPEAVLSSPETEISLERTGEGTVYYAAVLTGFTQDFSGVAPCTELSLRRRYYRLIPRSREEWLQLEADAGAAEGAGGDDGGSRSRIQPEKRPSAYRSVELAPGEAIRVGDRIEVELEMTASLPLDSVLVEDIKPAGCETSEVHSGSTWGDVYDHRELRREKVAFFLLDVPEGRRVLRYRMQAETAGCFRVLPAQAFAMYQPEIHTLSEAACLVIRSS